jgi:hypothetical protein
VTEKKIPHNAPDHSLEGGQRQLVARLDLFIVPEILLSCLERCSEF